jgi:hypothetical protein
MAMTFRQGSFDQATGPVGSALTFPKIPQGASAYILTARRLRKGCREQVDGLSPVCGNLNQSLLKERVSHPGKVAPMRSNDRGNPARDRFEKILTT